ncbi:hypothetical protein SLS58_008711 [Diplodia intermedia]|uniref:H-type lectin domain-containing protein n=1 Tax=Diplodia intermedia TaxID=856260 RepID=A0ABR3TH24_9PEZI
MEHLVAPYNDSMQLGQGFNSFTQELQDENAVSIEKFRPDASPSQVHSPKVLPQDMQGDSLSQCGSEASVLTSATPTSSQWNETKGVSTITDNGGDCAPVTGKDHKSPIVTFTSRSVDSLSDVTTDMNISAVVPIIHQSRNGSVTGLPFDIRSFCEADLNYFLSVRVVTRQDRPGAAFAVPRPRDEADGLKNGFGDCFISGFLEGGQLSALVSVRLKDKDTSSQISAALDTVLKISHGEFLPYNDATEAALRKVAEHCDITVEFCNVGGGPITIKDNPYMLESLRGVVASFPGRATKQPERIFAILTRYDSLGNAQTPTSLPCYDHCAFYANALLDAFMEFKAIERRLSAQISQIKSGTKQFQQQTHGAAKRRFDSSWRGITRAKRECATQMLKIRQEVETTRRNPGVAADDKRAEQFEDPLVFGDHLPEVVPSASAAGPASLWSGNEVDLFAAELATIKALAAEHPGISRHARMDTPCGREGAGQAFCSLEHLRPGWRLAEVSAYVSKGIVVGLSLRYTNGLATHLGAIPRRVRSVRLKLDLEAKEQVVGCSIEVGRAKVEPAHVFVTAVRLSTNRGSLLVAQAADWQEPAEGTSWRDGVEFERIVMTHFDPLLEGGHLHGFWGRASLDGISARGFFRLAPIWSNAKPPAETSVSMGDAVDVEDEGIDDIPCGFWDTYSVHDWEHPVDRTSAVVSYENVAPEKPIPAMMLGFRKMDTWWGANMRFAANVDFVTDEKFSIGVDQWSDSIFYGGEFSWTGIRPGTPGIQAGRFEARGSVKRDVKFAKPFTEQPQVLTWISGLDLDIKVSKRVDVHATNVDKTGFTMNVGSADSALAQASISWIAMSEDSGCIISSYGFQDDPEDCVDKVDESTRRFPEGKFSKPPKVLAGFTSFDISGSSENPRFGTHVWDVTADQFAWHIYAWGGSSISSARVHWIAIPAE